MLTAQDACRLAHTLLTTLPSAVERLQQLCAENLESAESRLQHVESLLGDRDVVETLAGMSEVWMPALAEAGNQAAEPAAGEPKGEDRAENF